MGGIQKTVNSLPLEFWRDWMLATSGVRGDVQILPETRERWAKEIAEYYEKNRGC